MLSPRGGVFPLFRQSPLLLANHIPRSVWDPAHHNDNWTDSYGSDIAARRHWSSKKWSVGLEPRTPSEWLKYSKRNLAYGYNGALRACTTFPEMVSLYKEMKQRGVKVDVDTMNILLTRGARHESLAVDDLFLLFDELVGLGVRPDVAAVETLHTVLDHAAAMPIEWREVRRRQLVEWYNRLAEEFIEHLKPDPSRHHDGTQHPLDFLLAQQMKRLRDNLKQLHASLSPQVYRQYFPCIHSSRLLLQELHNFLWEFVQPDHPATDIPALEMRIPFVALILKRPPIPGSSLTPLSSSFSSFTSGQAKDGKMSITDFEDSDVCSVFLAAVERIVEGDFPLDLPIPVPLPRLLLSIVNILYSSGVLYTSDLFAQMMDIVKYMEDDAIRDQRAQQLMHQALRGTAGSGQDDYRRLWLSIQPVVDGRVLGRYLASRHPWTMQSIHFNKQMLFRTTYPPAASLGTTVSTGEGETAVVPNSTAPLRVEQLRTPEAFQLRWADVKSIIKATNVLPTAPPVGQTDGKYLPSREAVEAAMEVFTGQIVFLRTAATGHRYEDLSTALATQAQGCEVRPASDEAEDGSPAAPAALFADLPAPMWPLLLQCLKEVHEEMERFMADFQPHIAPEPEFECWEGMLIVLRCIMDFAAARLRPAAAGEGGEHEGSASTGDEGVEALFKEAAELRQRLLGESLTRFGGRLKVLWLHEA